jgi:hypothetical protein
MGMTCATENKYLQNGTYGTVLIISVVFDCSIQFGVSCGWDGMPL